MISNISSSLHQKRNHFFETPIMTDIYLYLHNNLLLSKSLVYKHFIQLKNVFKTMLRIY